MQVFSNVRSAPVPVTVEELLTSQPLHAAIFRDAAESHLPVAMAALRFLGEPAACTILLMPRLIPGHEVRGLMFVFKKAMRGSPFQM